MDNSSYSPLVLLTPESLKNAFSHEFERTSKVIGSRQAEKILFEGLTEILENLEDIRDISLRKNEKSTPWKALSFA